MSHKKIYMSVTATAVIAGAFFVTDDVEAASHKVQPGDSLWKISQQHSVSISSLKKLNSLSGDIIHPNQVIETSGSNSSSGETSKPEAPSTSSSTYTVERGDNLSTIASTHKISLSNLMKWNNLDTTLIFPGNKLVVNKGGSSSTPPKTPSSKPSTDSGSTSTSSETYVVKSGDTLSEIAADKGVTVSKIKSANSLSSSIILIGQKLTLNSSGSSNSNSGSTTVKPDAPATPTPDVSADVDYDVNRLISTAKSATGVPYVWGGETMNGFDCSGFIHFAYNDAGQKAGRTNTTGYYNRSYEVDNPQVGDLVFFSGTYRPGISHMGIYVGNGNFIHAGSSRGVEMSNVSNSYWSKHFTSYKRFY